MSHDHVYIRVYIYVCFHCIQYIRLAHDTKSENVMALFKRQWKVELPKLVISVHGGIANFDLQPKLKRMFRKG